MAESGEGPGGTAELAHEAGVHSSMPYPGRGSALLPGPIGESGGGFCTCIDSSPPARPPHPLEGGGGPRRSVGGSVTSVMFTADMEGDPRDPCPAWQPARAAPLAVLAALRAPKG